MNFLPLLSAHFPPELALVIAISRHSLPFNNQLRGNTPFRNFFQTQFHSFSVLLFILCISLFVYPSFHMSSTEGITPMLNAIMQNTTDLGDHFMTIQHRLDELESIISVSRPSKQHRLIRKPISGKDFKRIPNVTLFMQKEIAKVNARATTSTSLLQFPEDLPLKDIQSSALSAIGLVLARHLDTDYGVISFNKLSFKKPALFARIVREL